MLRAAPALPPHLTTEGNVTALLIMKLLAVVRSPGFTRPRGLMFILLR